MPTHTRRFVIIRRALLVMAGSVGGLLASTAAFAQTNDAGSTRREGLGIGVVWTNQHNSKRDVGKFVSLRVSLPAGSHAGFDFDFGFVLRGKHTLPRGHALTGGTRVRLLLKARGESGVTGYLIAGVRLVSGTTPDVDGQRRRFLSTVVDWPGHGVDFVNAGGSRTGFEFGQSFAVGQGKAGPKNVEPHALFTSLFALGGRK